MQTRVAPVIPGPERRIDDAEEVDVDGWSVIDCLGAWDCMLVKFAMLQEIPAQHQEVWVEAFSRVLQMIEDADDTQKMTRALKWICFLPQALLRKPSRGGRSGRGLVAKRFNAVVVEDWGKLIMLWQKDMEKLGERQMGRADRSEEDEKQFLKRTAVDLVGKGQVSKAVSRICSNGVANIEDPVIMEQIREKYPERGRDIPGRVEKRQCVEGLGGLRRI